MEGRERGVSGDKEGLEVDGLEVGCVWGIG